MGTQNEFPKRFSLRPAFNFLFIDPSQPQLDADTYIAFAFRRNVDIKAECLVVVDFKRLLKTVLNRTKQHKHNTFKSTIRQFATTRSFACYCFSSSSTTKGRKPSVASERQTYARTTVCANTHKHLLANKRRDIPINKQHSQRAHRVVEGNIYGNIYDFCRCYRRCYFSQHTHTQKRIDFNIHTHRHRECNAC